MISGGDARLLLFAKPGGGVIVNESLAFTFAPGGEYAFGKFEKDPASPSYTAVADVNIRNGGGGGKMYLTCHNDMDNAYSCTVVRAGVMTDVTEIKLIN